MRISDWSSDVCSSDLVEQDRVAVLDRRAASGVERLVANEKVTSSILVIRSRQSCRAILADKHGWVAEPGLRRRSRKPEFVGRRAASSNLAPTANRYRRSQEEIMQEIGRASCREGVCKYV